jgi:hypothetical protein
MKKYVLLLFIVLGIGVHANAGDLFSLGIKAGGNFTTQKNTFMGNSLDPSGIQGFHAGLFSNVRIPLIGLGLEVDLLYSRKGSEYTYATYNLRNRFDYLDIPVYLQWSLNLLFVRPYIGIGPYFSIPMGTNISGNGNLPEFDSSRFNNSDFGFGAILGVELLKRFHVCFSYQLGTKNVYDGPLDIKVKNRNFAISLGYTLF